MTDHAFTTGSFEDWGFSRVHFALGIHGLHIQPTSYLCAATTQQRPFLLAPSPYFLVFQICSLSLTFTAAVFAFPRGIASLCSYLMSI